MFHRFLIACDAKTIVAVISSDCPAGGILVYFCSEIKYFLNIQSIFHVARCGETLGTVKIPPNLGGRVFTVETD